VGRTDEIAVLRRAVESAFAGGAGLAILEGEPSGGDQDVAAPALNRTRSGMRPGTADGRVVKR
jgi:hypothetical protein